jgi:hypothetical protein
MQVDAVGKFDFDNAPAKLAKAKAATRCLPATQGSADDDTFCRDTRGRSHCCRHERGSGQRSPARGIHRPASPR